MKRFAFCALLCLSATLSFGQFLDLGLHGGYGNTWLTNNNVSDQAANLDFTSSFAPMFGVHAGYFFKTTTSAHPGIRLEVNYTPIDQKYTGKYAHDSGSYNIEEKVNYITIPVLFHITGKVFYFEVGPQFALLNKATGNFVSSPVRIIDYSGRDIKAGYKAPISIAFGFGGHFGVTDRIYIDAGLRFAYGLTDATKDIGSTAANFNVENGVIDPLYGIGTLYANKAQNGSYSYKATHLAIGHVLIGVSYRLPFGDAKAAPATTK